jgi:hypothetical protein
LITAVRVDTKLDRLVFCGKYHHITRIFLSGKRFDKLKAWIMPRERWRSPVIRGFETLMLGDEFFSNVGWDDFGMRITMEGQVPKEKPKIIIVTRGGKVSSVRASTPHINVKVIDYDAWEAETDPEELEIFERLDNEYQEMIHPVW